MKCSSKGIGLAVWLGILLVVNSCIPVKDHPSARYEVEHIAKMLRWQEVPESRVSAGPEVSPLEMGPMLSSGSAPLLSGPVTEGRGPVWKHRLPVQNAAMIPQVQRQHLATAPMEPEIFMSETGPKDIPGLFHPQESASLLADEALLVQSVVMETKKPVSKTGTKEVPESEPPQAPAPPLVDKVSVNIQTKPVEVPSLSEPGAEDEVPGLKRQLPVEKPTMNQLVERLPLEIVATNSQMPIPKTSTKDLSESVSPQEPDSPIVEKAPVNIQSKAPEVSLSSESSAEEEVPVLKHRLPLEKPSEIQPAERAPLGTAAMKPERPMSKKVSEEMRESLTLGALDFTLADSTSAILQPKAPKVPSAHASSMVLKKTPVKKKPALQAGRSSMALSSGPAGPVRLTGVELQDLGPSFATVVIRSDKPILNYKSFALPDPPRLIVDISEAIYALPPRVEAMAKGPIKKIRTFQYQRSPERITRVVMELSSKLPYHIQSVPGPMQIVVGERVTTPQLLLLQAAQVPSSTGEVTRLPVQKKRGGLPGLTNLISVDLRQIDILAVIKFLAEEGDLNIVTGKNVGGRVTLSLKDVTIQDVIDIIALSYELAYVVQNGIIHVMTEADYTRLFGAAFADQRKVRTLQLKHADANAVATLLNNMKSAVGRVIADPQTRTLVMIDVPEKLEPMVTAAENMDQATKLQTQVFELHYGKAEDIQPEVEKVLTPNMGGVRLDKRTNTLVVTDLAPRMNDVQRVIRAFDRKTREVNIASKIVQIRLDDKFQMGVNWEVLFKQLSDLKLQGSFPILPPIGLAGPVGKLVVGTLANDDFTAVIELLQSVGKTNVLSTPQISVVENHEAKILVGTREAFVTSVVTQTQQAATTAEEVTFVDVGVKLTVTPTINREGYVTMKIKPEVSSVTRTLTTASGNQIPIIQESSAETTVMVKDGVTIIIAGLIEDGSRQVTKKVPILGDIPFLGAAFRSKEDEVIKSELVIFLTPTIISGKDSVASALPGTP